MGISFIRAQQNVELEHMMLCVPIRIFDCYKGQCGL
jgi:hypothetical protein